MLAVLTKILPRAYFATTLQTIQGIAPLHPPTSHLWPRGDGHIKDNYLKVIGWNVNGAQAIVKKNQLLPFLEQQKPDFLCLNETKTDLKSYTKNFKKSLHHEYHQYWNFCKVKSGYSGVLILARHKPLQVLQDFQQEQQLPSLSNEGRMLILQYTKFYLVNVYKPNTSRGPHRLSFRTQQYDPAFNRKMAKLAQKKPVVIFGDMNVAHQPIDLFNPRESYGKTGFTKEQRGCFNQLLQIGFKDTFRHLHPQKQQFSWWNYVGNCRQRNLGWRIDYILTTKQLKVHQAKIHGEVFGSDHAPVSAYLELTDEKQ